MLNSLKKWAWSVLVALDILLGALVHYTRPGETISHAAGAQCRVEQSVPACLLCKGLALIDPGHCDKVTY
jgi:hypothetical protein